MKAVPRCATVLCTLLTLAVAGCDVRSAPGETHQGVVCSTLDEAACGAASSCRGGYVSMCDCTCPGPAGYEAPGCAACAESCFSFVACLDTPAAPATCTGLDEATCSARSSCRPGYVGRCDCTCAGPGDYEGGGCEGCAASCFDFVACVDAGQAPATCLGRDEAQCTASSSCQAGYVGRCDCTCPGPPGYEGGGCEGCAASCFQFVACVPPSTVCTPGADQTCNDDPAVSSLWGTCGADGTCTCAAGFVINPLTGRCALPTGGTACTPGADQTCNESPMAAALWGACQVDGTCTCNEGFVVSVQTGRCTLAAVACTPGQDQTCNDDPAVSALWGTCGADGHCACESGFVLNPTSGRCISAL